MSAEVIKFPEPIIRPNLAKCRAAIELCKDDPGKLLFVAFNGVQTVYNRVPVKGGGDPGQATIDRLTIAYSSAAELIGATELVEALL